MTKMDLSNLQTCRRFQFRAIISEEAVDTVQETERQLVRDIRDRRLVPELRDRDLKVVRCLYTEDCLKRGFTCRNSKTIIGINMSALEVFDNDAIVTVDTLIEKGIVKNPRDGVKILGGGELTKKLTVQVNAFSESAKEKIEALGGKAEVI